MSTYRTFRQLAELDAIRRADTLRQLPGSLPSDDGPHMGAFTGILLAALIGLGIWGALALFVGVML